MRYILTMILSLVLATSALADKRAFIIGNAAYEELEPLRNTIADAEAYRNAFSRLGFDVTYLTDMDFDSTLDAFEAFVASVRPGDEVIFVYSGHGWSDGEVNYLIPTDAPAEGSTRKLSRASIALKNGFNGVLDDLEAAGAGLTVAIVDACRNNPFAAKPGTRSTSMSRGLAPVKVPQGTFVIFSAGEGQAALDRLPDDPSSTRLSVFTRTFLPHLTSGLYLEDAISKAQVETASLAAKAGGHLQHPAYYDQTLGFTCLVGNCTRDVVPAAQTPNTVATLPSAQNQCERLFEVAQTQNACFAYEAYAEACPNHIFAGLANRFIQRRCAEPEEAPQTVDLVRVCDEAAADPKHPDVKSGRLFVPGVEMNRINTETALRACLRAVENFGDNMRAHANLGRVYEARQEYTQARNAYTRAANGGDAYALTQLGRHYANGTGITRNDQTAFQFFWQAGEKGYAPAEFEIGNFYNAGRSVRQDYNESARWYRKASEKGDMLAQFSLAWAYHNGFGVNLDMNEATRWYKRSADQGYDRAQFNLGWAYQHGKGVPLDNKEASRLYKLSSDQGFDPATYNLGWLYENGAGVTRDYVEARRLYKIAAENGHAAAQHNYGKLFELGNGVAKDFDVAAEWYKKSLAQNNSYAMNSLAVLYANGTGVKRDANEAAKLMLQALKAGNSANIGLRSNQWNPDTAKALQRLLKKEGLYSGAIDGVMGAGAKKAMQTLVDRAS